MDSTVTHNEDERRYELRVGGELAGFVEYRPAGDSVIIAHTEVLAGHEGEGLGGVLVRATLEAIADGGQTVIPTCSFAAAYIGRHPELVEVVSPSLRGQFRD